ncbi:alanine--tRNA ligase [Blattabacterium cuenoti]|uniref:alanine--tRNA ligase n=1 Tax=Blattabacterium cuenoti TaxID=1653831 RepID=UPI00163C50A8|nr:alanine--tRNA ligase [Blattabacterium cuenoti]
MKYKYVRKIFLDFFQEKKHKIFPSFPIHLKNDPTLFFINAGMNPFKDFFLGNKKSEYPRIVNIQKCLRASGKHNDLENVGYDNYHHTMFEMLGNWSFGDYSRKEIIEWSWVLLTKVYNIPEKDIYISIFIGNDEDGLSMDKESLQYWKELIDKKNIVFFGKKDNFWEMGETGPCGPCSEIHIDLRNKEEKKKIEGRYLINQNHPEVIEIWNLVFIEFLRKENGNLEKLSTKHIDTGMGLERLCMVLQHKISSYETDIFFPIIRDIKDFLGKKYKKDLNQNISIRIVADHLRSLVFSISDGQLPSNNGAGYVIRKILRRAVVYVTRFLYKKGPFIYKFVDSLVREMKNYFPELEKKKDYIKNIIKEEEFFFLKIIEQGYKRMHHLIIRAKEKNFKLLNAHSIFKLYDTYGFPIKLSKSLAKENNLSIDEKSLEKKIYKQREMSSISHKKNFFMKTKDWVIIHDTNMDHSFLKNNFIGYDYLEYTIRILRYRKVEKSIQNSTTNHNNNYYELVFSKTPFYPEGGGQLGDTGFIKNEKDEIFIENTRKENLIILHLVKKLPFSIYSDFQAKVDKNRRNKIEINHTSTHLLHFSLKKILGSQVTQKGSYVGDKYLRFDFSYHKKISMNELSKIEEFIQSLINSNLVIEEKRSFPLKKAIEKGYSGLFHEKYEEKVRIITFGDFSELCIGTHIKCTELIQSFVILSEKSISHGVRRIKAITYKKAIQYLRSIHVEYKSLKEIMNNTKYPIKNVLNLQNVNKKLKQKLENLYVQERKNIKKEYLTKAISLPSITYVCDISNDHKEFDISFFKKIFLDLRNEISNLFLVVGFINKKSNQPIIFISISDKIIKSRNIHSYQIIKSLSDDIHGKSWGKSSFATSIGNRKEGLNLVLKKIQKYIKKYFE